MLASHSSSRPAAAPRASISRPELDLRVRTVRPSLLDLRFAGDPWIVERIGGSLALCLGNYPVAWIEELSLNVPSLHRLFYCLRHRRPRQHRPGPVRAQSTADFMPAR